MTRGLAARAAAAAATASCWTGASAPVPVAATSARAIDAHAIRRIPWRDRAEIAERGMDGAPVDRYAALRVDAPRFADLDADGLDDAVIAIEAMTFDGPQVAIASRVEVYSVRGGAIHLLATLPGDAGWPGAIDHVAAAPGRLAITWTDATGSGHDVTWSLPR